MHFIASGLFACLLICHIGDCFEGPLKHSNEHSKEISIYELLVNDGNDAKSHIF